MVDISNNKWTELDGGNTSASPDGVQGGYQPSTIAPIIRNIRGAVKREYVSTNPVYTSTGSVNAYAISFEQPLEITKGKRISFFANVTNTGASTINLNTLGAVAIVRTDGTPLQAGDIVENMPVDLVYDGTRYILQSSANLSNYSGTIKATAFEGNGSAITSLNASNISSGTINNARLPATQTGKTFSSETTVSEGGLKITAGGLTISAGGAGIGGDLSVTGAANITGNASIAGSLSQGGNTVLTSANQPFLLSRSNHTGTQAIATVAGLQAILDILSDPWACQPLGTIIAGGSALMSGWSPPQFDKSYQYILLSAGASGYHGNRIINESVTGSWPNITATGVINCPGSPFHGKTIRLINNERRFLRPGTLPGELQDFQNQSHVHTGTTAAAGWHDHELPSSVWSNDPGGNKVPGVQDGYFNQNIGGRRTLGNGDHVHVFTTNSSGGDETRPRNIGVSYYMRIL